MTYEQEREAKYNARKAQEYERNIQKVQEARNWAGALEIWGNFTRAQREDCVSKLEAGMYSNDYELQEILATLRVIKKFEEQGKRFIEAGNVAERNVLNNGEE